VADGSALTDRRPRLVPPPRPSGSSNRSFQGQRDLHHCSLLRSRYRNTMASALRLSVRARRTSPAAAAFAWKSEPGREIQLKAWIGSTVKPSLFSRFRGISGTASSLERRQATCSLAAISLRWNCALPAGSRLIRCHGPCIRTGAGFAHHQARPQRPGWLSRRPAAYGSLRCEDV
jgi:hypothetical protein